MPLSLTWIALALALLAVVAGVHELGARIHPWGPALGLALVSVAAFGHYRAALPSLARWALDRRERLLTQLKMPGGERMGMLMRACRSGLILLTGVALVSCVPSRMYRPVSVVPGPDYTMTYLELDEQGELWAPEQLSRILNQIEQANKQESGALVMLFIHGWHHNASPKDEQPDSGNITGFKRLISKTIALSRESDPDWSRPVIGIYVGWRGESIRLPILKSFSFWNRGRAAKRIAGVTATEVLAKILATSAGNPDTVSLLVGHSFGGRVLEKAVAQALVGGLVGHEAEKIDYPVSAIILVNPASQSILAKQLVEAFERDRTKIYSTDPKGRTYERPLMVSVTSAGDTATRVLFPAGLTVASLGKKFRRYGDAYCTPLPRQRSFYRKTAGHHSALHSHVVTAEPLSDDDRESAEGMGGVLDYQTSRDPVTGQRVFSFQGGKAPLLDPEEAPHPQRLAVLDHAGSEESDPESLHDLRREHGAPDRDHPDHHGSVGARRDDARGSRAGDSPGQDLRHPRRRHGLCRSGGGPVPDP